MLRKIRNTFAHAHEPVTFNDAAIQALCAKLRVPKTKLPDDTAARIKFLSTVASLSIRLEFYTDASGVIQAAFDPPVPMAVEE